MKKMFSVLLAVMFVATAESLFSAKAANTRRPLSAAARKAKAGAVTNGSGRTNTTRR